MKSNRLFLFVSLAALALFGVMGIQVNWMLETARIKEEIFNEKAQMVLSKTAEALSADTLTGRKQGISTEDREAQTIDSLVRYYMAFYGIKTGYKLEVKASPTAAVPVSIAGLNPVSEVLNTGSDQPGCYTQCLENPAKAAANSNRELKLVIPDKAQFIRNEMGIPFLTSIFLILGVMTLSWRTIRSLHREKQLAENTTAYLNNMTHELNTPLTNVALAGRMLTKEPNLSHPEKVRHYSGIILEESEKLQRQVEQVLGMTALERGEIPICKTEVDVHRLLSEVAQSMSVQVQSRGGVLDLRLEARNFMAMGDAVHLSNTLRNLIDNAIKYSPQNPEISVKTNNKPGMIEIAVSDKGIGIGKEFLHQIFDSFYRVPTGNLHSVKGFGLGLAYARKIAELHGASLGVHSEPGNGSTFTLTLPHA